MVPCSFLFFFFNDTATTEIYTLSLHDALPILRQPAERPRVGALLGQVLPDRDPLHPLRRRGGLPLSLGGDLPEARHVRLRRDGDLRARAGARLRLRVAQGRARVELTPD